MTGPICRRLRYDFEMSAVPIAYVRHRTGATTMPLLETDDAIPIEFKFVRRHVLMRNCHSILEARMPAYRALVVGRHSVPIGVIHMDCIDDESAISRAGKLVDSHDVELWQLDRPVARFDAQSGQICRK